MNIADWNLSTAHLSLEEEAIYFRLINHYYDTESPIPIETHSVFRRLRLGSSDEKALAILGEFFELSDKGWVHNRCEKVLKEYRKTAKKNKVNGAKGGRPRKNVPSSETQTKPSGLPDESKNNPNQEPLTINHKPITNIKGLSANTDEHVIFDYWCSVMNKNGSAKLTAKRKSCIKARIKEGYSVDQIKQAIDGCAKSGYHMGQNDQGTVYDDLTLICRSGDKVEFFIKNVAKLKGVSNDRRKESLAERSARQTAEALARIEAEEANSSALGANDESIRPQVGEPGRPSHDGERGVLDGVFTVVPKTGTPDR